MLVVWTKLGCAVFNRNGVGLVNGRVVVEVLTRRWISDVRDIVTLILQLSDRLGLVIVDRLPTLASNRVGCDWAAVWVNVRDSHFLSVSGWSLRALATLAFRTLACLAALTLRALTSLTALAL